ncbi:unnamed protein product [marine sediment metagenome]|uniref:Uncharacterized protein n=1 Tax=marine sediment metagenome TaxID=412755 RepID=X0SN35_9ZZZZ
MENSIINLANSLNSSQEVIEHLRESLGMVDAEIIKEITTATPSAETAESIMNRSSGNIEFFFWWNDKRYYRDGEAV